MKLLVQIGLPDGRKWVVGRTAAYSDSIELTASLLPASPDLPLRGRVLGWKAVMRHIILAIIERAKRHKIKQTAIPIGNPKRYASKIGPGGGSSAAMLLSHKTPSTSHKTGMTLPPTRGPTHILFVL
ncbi:MAG: hypothetical protein ABJP82_11465 [Hyphomicrobiales bacterium]